MFEDPLLHYRKTDASVQENLELPDIRVFGLLLLSKPVIPAILLSEGGQSVCAYRTKGLETSR